LLHISPEVVRLEERVPGNSAPLAELLPAMRSGGMAAVSELGVLGDPTTATAADGARLFAEMVDGCVGRIARWKPDRDGMLT
jgi:creatinine amidohydrolase